MIDDFIKKAHSGLSYNSIPLIKTCTEAEIGIPLVLLRGNHDGPTLYVGATIHGEELNGIGVIFKMLDLIQPQMLRGRILFVTIQNPIAFFHRQHLIPGDLYDTYKVPDVHTALPGSNTGQLAERTAHAIFKIIMCANYAVDLHTALPGSKYVDHSFSPSTSAGECANKAKELAEIFGTPIVVEMESGSYVAENMLHSVTTNKGVPTFGAELGQGGCIELSSVETGYLGMINVLRYLGMIDGEIIKNPTQIIVDKVIPIRTSTAGIVRQCVEIGALIEKGDEVAKIYDLYLREIESIRAPVAGIVYRQRTYPSVNIDERVAAIAVPKE
jgi:uncharacterized protein